MVIGADTGFLLAYAKGHPRAIEYWNAARIGEHYLVFSVLSVTEYFVYHIQRATLATAEEFIGTITQMPNMEIVPLDMATADLAARYRMGMNLATVDALILATLLNTGCELLLTTDSDFVQSSVQNVIRVELLR